MPQHSLDDFCIPDFDVNIDYTDIGYDYQEDIKNERFEKIFAEKIVKFSYQTRGYAPEYDVIDLKTLKKYEIKRDYWWIVTDNILIEDLFNLEKKEKGWIHLTEADFLVTFVTDHIFHITDMHEIKTDWLQQKNTWRKIDIKQYKDKEGRPLKKPFKTRNWVKPLKEFKYTLHSLDKQKTTIGITNEYLREKRKRIAKLLKSSGF